VDLCIRQQDVKIIKEGQPLRDPLKDNVIAGTIASVVPFPEYCMIYFKSDDSRREYDFEIKLPPYLKDRHDLFPGKAVRIAFWEPNIIVFPRNRPPSMASDAGR
jgi:hypothetical protein